MTKVELIEMEEKLLEEEGNMMQKALIGKRMLKDVDFVKMLILMDIILTVNYLHFRFRCNIDIYFSINTISFCKITVLK